MGGGGAGAAEAPEHVLDGRYRFMLVSDLDWTMVDHADATHAKLLCFNRCWMQEFGADSLLVFSTGRSPPLFHELAGEVPLLTPDILVCSVGTEILINGEADTEWEAHLNVGWDRGRAAEIGAQLPDLALQRESEQRPHKISYKLKVPDPERVLGALRERLAAAGLDCNVIYSGGEDVDILPSRASKGKALAFLLAQMERRGGRPAAGVLVCGDSGNDVELFAVPGVHGCVVANAHAELRQWAEANAHDRIFFATQDGPGGIYEALHHFSFPSPAKADTVHRRGAIVGSLAWIEEWVNGGAPRDDAECRARLAAWLDDSFEYVQPSGAVLSRAQLVDWFVGEGYASRARAPGGGGDGSSGESGGRAAMWVDRWSERELAPGVWLARYLEVHQPFAAGEHTGVQRTGRWACAVLKRAAGGGGAGSGGDWRIAFIQETPVPREAARA